MTIGTLRHRDCSLRAGVYPGHNPTRATRRKAAPATARPPVPQGPTSGSARRSAANGDGVAVVIQMNDKPMASRLPPVAIEPPRTPTTPSFVITDTGVGEPSFPFSCDDDDDGDGDDGDPRYLGSPVAHSPGRNHFLAASPRSSPATFLYPRHQSTLLRPPTPDSPFLMATEDGLANGGSDAHAPKNPFNFQTQFISTGPVKSVRLLASLSSPQRWRARIRPADFLLLAHRTSASDEATVTNTAP